MGTPSRIARRVTVIQSGDLTPSDDMLGRDRARDPRLVGWAWLSIGAAITTIALKSAAYLATGSVGLLSDALESVVNLVAAVLALSP